ncbi:hypothetical protein [Saliphagus infecundisoli]|uniref:Uncharacterized protein n=1 Tax=Saliphagus infecundisoli TaxID=1849069 RepID=A0ABD5QLH6_9EURY|nr:hypothetical protein [Saliphagus infecundisoli]
MTSATVEASIYDERWHPPPLPHVDGVRWYHKATTGSNVFVKPSHERASLPATIEFTLVNRSDQPLQGGSSTLYKLQDNQWYSLTFSGLGIPNLSPDDEKTYTLHLSPEEVNSRDRAGRYGPLGGGMYAFDTGHRTEVRYNSRGLAVAAIIVIDSDPLELTPAKDIQLERNDATITVTDARYEQADASHQRTLCVERGELGGQALITEQLMRGPYEGLRNCLPFFDGDVDRVILRSDTSTSSLFSPEFGPARFTYNGEGYEVRPLDDCTG